MKFFDIMDKEEEGSFITFETRNQAEVWLEKETNRNSNRIEENGMHIVGNERLTVYERRENAFAIANNAIYFNDNSDYLSALYDICKMLRPDVPGNIIGEKYIEITGKE